MTFYELNPIGMLYEMDVLVLKLFKKFSIAYFIMVVYQYWVAAPNWL